ncbi:conserved hypothetical protein [Candidatus Nitrotoga fabula]|uniref:Uncharacterized protein n=1 Tax=Candidatus Nitrotoga fabula TaxID=2182327 RepID=A0A916BD14_9PROT|nr:conserved hypothetical protein [Candidatus Nitrotoga fabula]
MDFPSCKRETSTRKIYPESSLIDLCLELRQEMPARPHVLKLECDSKIRNSGEIRMFMYLTLDNPVYRC